MSFADLLSNAQRMGVSGIEVNTGGWSTAPHFDLASMKGNAQHRKRFLQAFADHGLEVISLGMPMATRCIRPTALAHSGSLTPSASR
ncbi:MAG: hypothetical protein R3E89_13985 [Thiolinea sp.]